MTGRVLASFARVCDLVTDGGEVVALVWDEVGNGPLNVMLEREPGVALPAGARFVVNEHGQVTGASGGASRLRVDLASATVWDARPDWEMLRARRGQIATGARIVAQILAEHGLSLTSCGLPQRDCDALSRYPFRNPQSAIRNLIGLGPGLTPAGDDWLAGWLLGLRLEEDWGVRSAADLVLTAAETRTTLLSRAFLACAAAGEMDANWHALLDALAGKPTTNLPIYPSTHPPIYQFTNLPIYQSTLTILAHGATSGAAMLMGFVAGIDVW